jgi:hypothetical protein
VPIAVLAGGTAETAIILALDLGHRMGWALGAPDGGITSGTECFLVAQIYPHKFHPLGLQLEVGGFEGGGFGFAWLTPRPPKVHHDNFAFEIGQLQFTTTKEREHKRRGGTVGFGGSRHHGGRHATTDDPHNRHNHQPNQATKDYHHQFTPDRVSISARWWS